VVGYYAGYAIGLLVLGVSEIGMLLLWRESAPSICGAQHTASNHTAPNTAPSTAAAAASSRSSLLGGLLYAVGRQPDAEVFVCGQDQLGSKFLQQVLLGFATPKVFELGSAAFHYWRDVRLKGQPWTKRPLKLENKFVRNVYFQGLMWIAVPYLPLMALLMPLVLWIDFQFDRRYLVRLCSKETQPFQFDLPAFLVFHGITLFGFVALWAWLFLRASFASACCGPFYDVTTATSVTVSAYMQNRLVERAGDWLDDLIEYVLDNAYLLWLAIFYLAYANSDNSHRAARLQEASEDRTVAEAADKLRQATRIESLEREVARWKKKCKELRTQAADHGEDAE